MSQATRILFALPTDEFGYPPFTVEYVDVEPVDPASHLYRVESIPFFLDRVCVGDTIAAVEKQGELWFSELVEKSGHSTLRLQVLRERDVRQIVTELRFLGCDTERGPIPGLVTVDVPPEVGLAMILQRLDEGVAEGKWTRKNGAIRHL